MRRPRVCTVSAILVEYFHDKWRLTASSTSHMAQSSTEPPSESNLSLPYTLLLMNECWRTRVFKSQSRRLKCIGSMRVRALPSHTADNQGKFVRVCILCCGDTVRHQPSGHFTLPRPPLIVVVQNVPGVGATCNCAQGQLL